ncbi:PREDICTED: EF-hand and coiled-coil domain-containing protein 1 isoform X1 [Cercocebus atys]|nr:PREDICTED: EF-hand and coiled-coil domain-containing protein 1 isoform X1 [Cercocebus atys]
MEPDSAGAEAGIESAGGDPYRRPARRTQWLLSALAHHYGLDRGVENEIVVLATGLDQYLQEVFHHLDCRGAGRLPRADFRALCAVLGLRAEGATAAGEAVGDANSRAVTTGDAAAELATDGDSDTDEEARLALRAEPPELTFRQFHARLCGYFGTRAGPRLPRGALSEHIETQIRLRRPRRRRRPPCASGPDSGPDCERVARLEEENSSLRELVEDLRAALQSSDARCLALQASGRFRRQKCEEGPDLTFKDLPASWSRLTAPSVNQQRLTGLPAGETDKSGSGRARRAPTRWSAADRRLRCGNCGRHKARWLRRRPALGGCAVARPRCGGARRRPGRWCCAACTACESWRRWRDRCPACSAGCGGWRRSCNATAAEVPYLLTYLLCQEAHCVPQHIIIILHQQFLRESCSSQSEDSQLPTPQLASPEPGDKSNEPEDAGTRDPDPTPEGAWQSDSSSGSRALDEAVDEQLFRSVEGQAASDKEEEEEEKWREEQKMPAAEAKTLLARLSSCRGRCDDQTAEKLMTYCGHFGGADHACTLGELEACVAMLVEQLRTQGCGGRTLGTSGEEAELQQKVEENEHLRLELQMVETERVRLSLLEEKLVDVLQLLQRLRDLNISKRALGKILLSTLDAFKDPTHVGRPSPAAILDALHQALAACQLLRRQPSAPASAAAALANPLLVSC